MKFPAPARAPEGPSAGLTSYARRPRIRPVQIAINIFEALLGLLGVVVIILALRYGSFEKAGAALDGAFGCLKHGLTHGLAALIAHKA
ncbi:MAG TPA: hypothetical protein VN042_05205 [Asticcacaulis sp.]|jgi:hypothetical protein|nr:hypothetical protein [Asticcacaulis sp.]